MVSGGFEPGDLPFRRAVTLQFHPDWPYQAGTVSEALASSGVYRSQFVTGISNGGLTAYPGGDRWRWESRLFAGRYDARPAEERPVYGAWNRRADPYGAAVRFGSAYLQLRTEVSGRTTFCFPDSVFEPEHFGGPEVLPELCALADRATDLDPLDEAVEAQVHGPVLLSRDVEAIVLDPCFADSPVAAAAATAGCPVRYHPGFRVATAGLDPTYRGEEYVRLARSLGPDLTPDVIGRAARSGQHDLQALKRVWHYLARFGRSGRLS